MTNLATRIATSLREALIENGPMSRALYEYELEEHINYWHSTLLRDNEDFAIMITERDGQVAMLLIEVDKSLYINEVARGQLKAMWPKAYLPNMIQFIPMIIESLMLGEIFFTGVKVHQ
ncbi:MAG: hypothetical protein AAFV72_21965 [Cyanobacteria bacterium J06635_1]